LNDHQKDALTSDSSSTRHRKTNPGGVIGRPQPESDGWFTPWRFCAVLGFLMVVCFPQVLAGFESFASRESGLFAYPVAFYHRECFWRGEIPLWNPLNSCGIPFLAQWNTLTLYPPSLFYLLLPLPWSFDVFRLGHLFLGGVGMYFLANRWTRVRLGAAVAGVAFTFNGFTWCGLVYPHLIAALAWMPWLLLATERAWRGGTRAVILAALVAAMQVLSGGAEVVLLTWLLLAVLWMAEFASGQIPRLTLARTSLGIGVLTAGLTAVQMLPFLELLAHSDRISASTRAVANFSAMPLTGWMNYLLPLFQCVRSTEGVFVQLDQPWVPSYYLGVGIVLLALLAAWRVRNRRVWVLAGLTLGSLWMALGSRGGAYDFARRVIPLLDSIHFPIKFVALVTFTVPLLAGFGIARLQSLSAKERRREWAGAKGLAALIAIVIGTALWFAWHRPAAGSDFAATAANAAVRAAFLLLVVVCIARLLRAGHRERCLWQVALVVLLWFDVLTSAPRLSPMAASGVLQPDRIRNYYGWGDSLNAGVSRAMLPWNSIQRIDTFGSESPETEISARRMALFMNYNLLDHAAKTDGFYSLNLEPVFHLFAHVLFATNEATGLKDFLGISHISNPTDNGLWDVRTNVMPLVSAGQMPVFGDLDRTLSAVLSDGFNPRDSVYLPLQARGSVTKEGRTNARIVSSRFSAERLNVEVDADAPAMVVVAQAFYPCWHAYVDGKPTRLWQANYAFQALAVPAGRHEIRLAYEDGRFIGGTAVSLFFLAACAAGWIASGNRERVSHRLEQELCA
jgi:hypothetical protein